MTRMGSAEIPGATDMNADTLKGLLATTSPGPWAVEIDGPTWGWVEVKGPSFKVSGPTKATDLSYADKVRRENDARLIALAPQLAADNIALQAEVEEAKGIGDRAAGYLDVASDEIKRLQAENARLRASLEWISSGNITVFDADLEQDVTVSMSEEEMQAEARAALHETPSSAAVLPG